MKVHLIYPDRDLDAQQPLPWNEAALRQDLSLDTLLHAMARDDSALLDTAQRVLLTEWTTDPETIAFRQAILADVLANPAQIRELYNLAIDAVNSEHKRYFGVWGTVPSSVLHGSVEMMQFFVGMLRRLRDFAGVNAPRFSSEGLCRLFTMLERELSEEYLAEVEEHLAALRFRNGTLISAELGAGNVGRNHVLRRPHRDGRSWLRRLLGERQSGLTFRLADRDETGARILSELNNRGIRLVANALAQSVDHVTGFFHALRSELAFYVGALNLHEQLTALGEPTCLPRPLAVGMRRLSCHSLYDPCLALEAQRTVVANTVESEGQSLIIVTGANQGGKSVFLRSVGLAHIMMRSGMFVAAERFESDLASDVVTHYKREEDASMRSGKLDEELARLSDIVGHISPDALLLLNESFAATNEREGSEIARQVVSALLEKGMKVVFVTHLYSFARSCHERNGAPALFLRAERRTDGTRTFRLVEGEPEATSHGRDLYDRIFASSSTLHKG